jgi:hypothetical protein
MWLMTSQKTVDRAARGLTELAEAIEDTLGRPPTLAELPEVLGWAARPLTGTRPTITPKVRGKASTENQAAELPDHVHDTAAELVNAVTKDVRKLGDIVLAGLKQAGEGVLSDVDPADITAIKIDKPTGPKRPKPGDLFGIPVDDHRVVPAVVITKNDFGLALGLFGEPVEPPVSLNARTPIRKRPVYTDQERIADGSWPSLGHDTKLLKLFPADPEMYYPPRNDIPGMDYGPHGTAESPDGSTRDLTEQEAREIGVLDPGYQQIWSPDDLQAELG